MEVRGYPAEEGAQHTVPLTALCLGGVLGCPWVSLDYHPFHPLCLGWSPWAPLGVLGLPPISPLMPGLESLGTLGRPWTTTHFNLSSALAE